MARRRSFSCPHCGALVASGALACAECGSDAQSGWSEQAEAWAGDLPTGYGRSDNEAGSDGSGDDDTDDDELDYEEFLRREGLGDDRRPSRAALARRRVAAVCLLLVICILLWLVMH